MSKRMENMLDATLPPPPPVNDFMECLREVADGKAKPVEGDLFDGLFENEVDTVGKPAGTMGVHKTAVRLVLNFEALRALKGVELADLDGKHGEKRCTRTAAHKCINRLKPA